MSRTILKETIRLLFSAYMTRILLEALNVITV